MGKNEEEFEIDLVKLYRKLYKKKKIIITSSLVGALVGLIIAFSIPKEYMSKVILVTGNAKGSGSMGMLASIAGVNLSGGDDTFPPELYKEVLNSTPFIQSLFDIKVIDEEGELNTTFYDYIKTKQKNPWWSYLLMSITNLTYSDSINSMDIENGIALSNKRYMSSDDMNVIESIRKKYSIDTNIKTGLTTIEVITQNPIVSALLADSITAYLQEYIIGEKTKKAKIDLYNSEKLYNQSKNNYYQAQQNLANFIDSNKNVVSAKYKVSQDRYQNEANVAYSVYNQMAQQLQMNKIKVQNNTPVFTIIQPAIEPLNSIVPKKKIIFIVSLLIFFMCSSIYVLRDDIKNFIVH